MKWQAIMKLKEIQKIQKKNLYVQNREEKKNLARENNAKWPYMKR